MRTTEEALTEILRRAEIMKKEHELRRLGFLSTLACVLTVGLIVLVSRATGSPAQEGNAVMGAFLLGPEVGAYVLVAIAALITGMSLSTLIYRKRELDSARSSGREETSKLSQGKEDTMK
ncbi:MAG: hypothetical protein IJV40_07515 [Oscillospiraceae bacterium]|nr:hypothetical protein [Oscillospiraceae bacterium]